MPAFETTQRFGFGRAKVFDFFARPANVIAVSPPGLTLVEGPARLGLGSRVTVRVRRFGLTTTVATEVVEFAEGERVVEVQVQGPLRAWRHERVFDAVGEAETVLRERIEYEAPGGILGLTLTAKRVEADLEEAYAWRYARTVELLASNPSTTGSGRAGRE
jgi:ligand-binding SRPBCC domain-containing protein